MLTRRGFAGFVSCAICAVSGFRATDVSARTPLPSMTLGVKRTLLSQIDGPIPGYTTVVIENEISPGVTIARHTHPGNESAYVLDGGMDLVIEGQEVQNISPGDVFQVPAGVPHNATNGDKTTRYVSSFVVEKNKPLSSPA